MAHAQDHSAAALGELVAGLGTTARVMVIGAHPDDEDTQLIAWLAKGRHVETAYLSLTRGDGGQNLIGNELGPVLGMIRTEELLAARRIDGGRQYFTRAYDFGFSKDADETLKHWQRDSILKDMVAIVRAFKPHVIISIWSGTPADGHGHHQVAGILAREVFDAAADTVRFPTAKMAGLPAWTPLKFFRSRAYRQVDPNETGIVRFDVGEYDPLLGKTYSQIATESRSQHRSQGQGALAIRGSRMDAVRLEVSRVESRGAGATDIFDGIDTSWARFKTLALSPASRAALDSLPTARRAVGASLNLAEPSASVAPLANYLRLLGNIEARRCSPAETRELSFCSAGDGDLATSLGTSYDRARAALLAAAAVSVDANAPRELIAEGDSMPVTISVYNEGKAPVGILGAGIGPRVSSFADTVVPPDAMRARTLSYRAPPNPSAPWWLTQGGIVSDMFVYHGIPR